MEKTIKISCQGADEIPLDELIVFQGELKNLSRAKYKKLRAGMLEHGLLSPIHIWIAPEGQKQIMDGTQRVRLFREMRDAEGYSIPPLPVNYVHADNAHDAAKKLLVLAGGHYGEASDEGLFEFMSTHKIQLADVKDVVEFADIDLLKFEEKFFDMPIAGVDDTKDLDTNTSQFIVTIKCQDEHEMQQIFEEMTNRGHECKLIT